MEAINTAYEWLFWPVIVVGVIIALNYLQELLEKYGFAKDPNKDWHPDPATMKTVMRRKGADGAWEYRQFTQQELEQDRVNGEIQRW